MRSWTAKLAAAALAASLAGAGARPAFKALLAEAGLAYAGKRAFAVDINSRRGDWRGKLPAFWTLTAAEGRAFLRLELTRNVSREQAERTMAERFYRVQALYAGGAAYPGMVTTEFEVPKELRPVELKAGAQGNRALALPATANFSYGAGSEDLAAYRAVMGYVYCAGSSTLAQAELFLPKENYAREAALEEFSGITCAGPAGAEKRSGKKGKN